MMEQKNNSRRPITGVYPILRFAIDRGINTKLIFEETGLNENDFLNPQNDIFLDQELAIIRNLIVHAPEPETAWDLGGYFTTKAHGVLGSLMASAPTVGDMIYSVVDYCMLGHSFFNLYPETVDDRIRIYLVERYPTGTLLPFVTERDIKAGISAVETRLPGKKNCIIKAVSFSHGPRAGIEKYKEAFVDTVLFDQPRTCFDIARSSLSLNISDGNDQVFELIRQQCRMEFSLRNEHHFFLSDRVKLFLQAEKEKIDFVSIAKKLNMSERSFRRELSKEGISFRQIKNQMNFQHSLRLLRDSRMHIEEISNTLGYSETRAFIRAFQKWTGLSPGKYRKKYNTSIDRPPA